MKNILILISVVLFLAKENSKANFVNPDSSSYEQLTITVLYNKVAKDTIFKPGNGFSCFINGLDKTILFDAGQKSDILLNNIEQAHINPNNIQLLIISHIHSDHFGGLYSGPDSAEQIITLGEFGWKNLETAYLPVEIPEPMAKNQMVNSVPALILPNVYLSGVLPGVIPNKVIHGDEQSLIIDTNQGLVIITGCAHPGIVNIIKRAKEIVNKEIYFVLGGFHLMNESEENIKSIVNSFKSLGVKFCAPLHCTGQKAENAFKDAYGNNYFSIGAGGTIAFNKDGKLILDN